MTAKDHQKLLNIGFTILRRDSTNLKIKMKTPNKRDWHTLQSMFANRHQLEKRMNELLSDEEIIED